MSDNDADNPVEDARQKRRAAWAVLATLLACLFWGSNFQVMTIALSSFGPWTSALERFVIASATILMLLWLREGISLQVLRRNAFSFFWLGLVGIAGFNGMLFIGLNTASPITAALIMATTPVTTNLVEALISHRRPNRVRYVGMVISMLGVLLVVTGGQFSGSATAAIPLFGVAMIFVASLAWVAYTIGTEMSLRNTSPLSATAWTMTAGTLALVVLSFTFEQPLESLRDASLASHLANVYLALPGAVIAFLFWNIGARVRGAGKTAVLYNFVPIFALLVSALAGAPLGPAHYAGTIITVFGVLVGQYRKRKVILPKTAS